MVSVMKKLTIFNVIMMAEIVVYILIWLIMASVMMKQTILSVTMMVETVVDLLFPVSNLVFFLEKKYNSPIFHKANLVMVGLSNLQIV